MASLMLSRRLLSAYAFPALPLAALTLPAYIYLPSFYAQDLGLGLGVVGGVLLAARLWDVVTDPVMGWLSDRSYGGLTRRFGRRRLWLIAGAPLVMLATWMLFVPSGAIGVGYLLAWSAALYLGWTMMILPLSAMSAELSDDYHQRSRLAGWREGAALIGTLAALSALALFQSQGHGAALRAVAIGVVLLLPIATAYLAWRVPEPTLAAPPSPLAPGNAWRALAANRPFARLIGAYLLNGFANGLPATLFLLFVESRLEAATFAGPLLFIYFLAGIIAVPVWLRVSARYGKHRTWCAAMIGCCAAFVAVPFLQPGDVLLFGIICVLTGLCLGADLVLPSAMQSDVVDVDSLQSGARRAGMLFALWGMATKLALALAVGIAFPLLDWAGGAGAMLVALYSLVPIAFKLAAIGLMWGYPLTAQAQAQAAARLREIR